MRSVQTIFFSRCFALAKAFQFVPCVFVSFIRFWAHYCVDYRRFITRCVMWTGGIVLFSERGKKREGERERDLFHMHTKFNIICIHFHLHEKSSVSVSRWLMHIINSSLSRLATMKECDARKGKCFFREQKMKKKRVKGRQEVRKML